MNLRPLQDRILVKRVEEETTTKGGIIIPDTAKEKPAEGEVVAMGQGKLDDDGKRIAMDVKVSHLQMRRNRMCVACDCFVSTRGRHFFQNRCPVCAGVYGGRLRSAGATTLELSARPGTVASALSCSGSANRSLCGAEQVAFSDRDQSMREEHQ